MVILEVSVVVGQVPVVTCSLRLVGVVVVALVMVMLPVVVVPRSPVEVSRSPSVVVSVQVSSVDQVAFSLVVVCFW